MSYKNKVIIIIIIIIIIIKSLQCSEYSFVITILGT